MLCLLTLTEEVTTSVHTTTRDGVDMRGEGGCEREEEGEQSKVNSLSGGLRGGTEPARGNREKYYGHLQLQELLISHRDSQQVISLRTNKYLQNI